MNDTIINEILKMRADGIVLEEIKSLIKNKYGIEVSCSYISDLCCINQYRVFRQATDNDIKIIREMYALGMSKTDIATKTGWGPTTVSRIVSDINLPKNKIDDVLFYLRTNIYTYKDIIKLTKVSRHNIAKIAMQNNIKLQRNKNSVADIFFKEYMLKDPLGDMDELAKKFYEDRCKDRGFTKLAPGTLRKMKHVQNMARIMLDHIIKNSEEE